MIANNLPNFWTLLIKLPIDLTQSEELLSLSRLMFLYFHLWAELKGHLCPLPQANMCPAIYSLHKHVTLSTIQPGPCGSISNEHFSGPSGLGVLAGVNASGLCVHVCVCAPGPNMAALDQEMLWGLRDKPGWSEMVVKYIQEAQKCQLSSGSSWYTATCIRVWLVHISQFTQRLLVVSFNTAPLNHIFISVTCTYLFLRRY